MIKRAPGKSSAGEAGRKSSAGGMAALGINPHGKRPREATIKEEGVPIKKVS
jgi:senataxin